MSKNQATAALKHGGGAGELALTKGADFTGLAAAVEQQVTNELEISGDEAIVKRNAIRLQTVADLYYQAILGAEDLEHLDTLVKRFGWIAGSALRAWQQVRELEKHRPGVVDVTELIRGDNGD